MAESVNASIEWMGLTGSARENGLVRIGHHEFVQFIQIAGRDALTGKMADQDLSTEIVVNVERIDRVLRHLPKKGSCRRCKERVAQLSPYFNQPGKIAKFKILN